VEYEGQVFTGMEDAPGDGVAAVLADEDEIVARLHVQVGAIFGRPE
jgi:hypothetical protein